MKKKLVISIVSIMSFILLLSGILILNNKEVKNSSVDKEIKSENQEDTTWQEDFEYKKDKKNKILVLGKYNGSDKDITIPPKAVIDGVEYRVMTYGVNANTGKVFEDIDSLTIEDGVMFPTHDFFSTKTNAKKIKIGNVDLSMLDFFNFIHGLTATEELDLSDFDNTSMERLSNTKFAAFMYAPKIILGKKNVLLKKWNGVDTKINLCSTRGGTCYWLREETNEVYSSNDLPYLYDGETMSGTYLEYKDGLVQYDLNGIDGNAPFTKVDGSATVINNTFKRYGYEFVEWNTKRDGTGDSYLAGSTITTDKPVVLYAIWNRTSNDELETKTLHLSFHLNSEDAEYSKNKYYLMFKMYLKLNGEQYTDKIKVISNGTEKNESPSNGYYYLSYQINNDGIDLVLPKDVEYELVPVIDDYTSELIKGKLTDNISVDSEVKIIKTDVKIYFLTEDPFHTADEYSFYVEGGGSHYVASGKTYEAKYDGDKEGTLIFKEATEYHYITISDGDIITVHDVPIGTYWNVHASQAQRTYSELYYVIGCDDTSGYLQSENINNHTIIYKYNSFGTISLIKKTSSSGVEDKKFKFKITAKLDLANKPLTGKYPYEITELSGKPVETGKIEFDKNGVAYAYLKSGEQIYIGRKYSYDLEIHDEDSIIPKDKFSLTYEEVELDENMYNKQNTYSANGTESIPTFYNSRKNCSLKIQKYLEVNVKDFSYNNLKTIADESYILNVEDKAISTLLNNFNREVINKYLNEDQINEIDEHIENELSNKTESTKNSYVIDYLKENKSDLNQEELIKLYDDYLNTNKDMFYNAYKTKKFKYKLHLKDNAPINTTSIQFQNYYNSQFGSFPIMPKVPGVSYDNDKYTEVTLDLQPTVNLIINGEKKSEDSLDVRNLWCGMEYELEEVDADEYDKVEKNTKGILKYDETPGSTNITIASITNKDKTGTLTLNKKIKGNVSKDEEFKFDITLKLSDKDETKYNYTGSKEGTLEFVDGKASITLKGGESIKLENLPFGIEYKVVENTKGYKVKKENDTGTIDKETVVTFTNSKDVISEVNTLDGIGKYIAVALVSIIGIVTTIFLRKHSLER